LAEIESNAAGGVAEDAEDEDELLPDFAGKIRSANKILVI
jgi:hypothetical protein